MEQDLAGVAIGSVRDGTGCMRTCLQKKLHGAKRKDLSTNGADETTHWSTNKREAPKEGESA